MIPTGSTCKEIPGSTEAKTVTWFAPAAQTSRPSFEVAVYASSLGSSCLDSFVFSLKESRPFVLEVAMARCPSGKNGRSSIFIEFIQGDSLAFTEFLVQTECPNLSIYAEHIQTAHVFSHRQFFRGGRQFFLPNQFLIINADTCQVSINRCIQQVPPVSHENESDDPRPDIAQPGQSP